MKTNAPCSIFNWFDLLLVTFTWQILYLIAIMNFVAIDNVKAQTPNLNNSNAINGLFTPTQSQEFFRQGRKNFQREVEIFTYPERYLNDDLLQIDPELIEQMNQKSWKLNRKDAQYKLYLDTFKSD